MEFLFNSFLPILSGLAIVFAAFIARVLGEDAKTFLPRIAERLVRAAAKRVPHTQQERYEEEWLAHLNDCEEMTGKLWHAFSCYFVASRNIRLNYVRKLSTRRRYALAACLAFLTVTSPLVILISFTVLFVFFRGKSKYSSMKYSLVFLCDPINQKFRLNVHYMVALYNPYFLMPLVYKRGYKILAKEFFGYHITKRRNR